MTCLEEPQCLTWGCHLGRLYFFFSKVQLAAGTQYHHRLLAVGYPGSGVTGFAVLHSAKEGGNVKGSCRESNSSLADRNSREFIPSLQPSEG